MDAATELRSLCGTSEIAGQFYRVINQTPFEISATTGGAWLMPNARRTATPMPVRPARTTG